MEHLILALATWRISSLITYEDGPFGVFERLRSFVGVYYDEYSQRQGKNELARGALCLWCNSVWIGAVVAVLFCAAPQWAVWAMMPFALSAGAVLVDGMVERNGTS